MSKKKNSLSQSINIINFHKYVLIVHLFILAGFYQLICDEKALVVVRHTAVEYSFHEIQLVPHLNVPIIVILEDVYLGFQFSHSEFQDG